jgi:hypothetical protein
MSLRGTFLIQTITEVKFLLTNTVKVKLIIFDTRIQHFSTHVSSIFRHTYPAFTVNIFFSRKIIFGSC